MAWSDPLPLSTDELLATRVPGRHDPAVPTPEEVLGYRLGERLSRHADCVSYLSALAAASDKAVLQPFGRSVEGRQLVHLVVSTPANLARLEAIQAATQALVEPDQPLPDLADLPATTWVIANVHGGEHSSAEAALALAYQLVAGLDETTASILAASVVVIDPLQNPDGRDRSVNSYYSLHGVVPNPDPNSCEHAAPWPGERGSHYAFDLNRDWCLLTHPESRARVAAFLRWRPVVVADLHEMGAAQSYYFAPPAQPLEANIADSIKAGWEVFGRANAAAFDRRSWDYFVGEVFDSYYPGYGEAWPLYHGTIGMTYEQASPQTLAVRRRDGHLLTLAEAASHHLVAAYTTCLTAAARREALLRGLREFAAANVAAGEAGPRRALVLAAADRAPDAADLAAHLRAQGVTLHVAGEPFTASAEPHSGGRAVARRFAAGSLVIPLAQPAGRLVRALCDAVSPMQPEFVQQERDRLAWRADANIYDITAWSLPYRWDLEAAWLDAVPSPPPAATRRMHGDATMAWLVPAGSRAAYRLLCRLLSEPGWRVRVASRAFTFAGRDYGRGSLVLRVRDHEAGLRDRLEAVAEEAGADLFPADTAWSEEGIRLGSYYVRAVEPPRIGVLTRPPVAAQAVGWLCYLLEQEYHLAHTPLNAGTLTAKVLADYNVLVMPDGGSYERVFGTDASWLKAWVQAGGTLVALGGAAAAYLVGRGDLFTAARLVRDLRHPAAEPEEKPAPVPAEHRPRRIAPLAAWVKLDPYSFLTYGCGERLRVGYGGERIFTPTPRGHTVARFLEGDPIVAGFVPTGMAGALAGQAYLWQERVGAGQVIAFADAPTFRASWPGLDRLWLNALLFGPSLSRE